MSDDPDLPDEFLEFLKRSLTPESLSEGFAEVAGVRITVTPEIANRIVTNPAQYGMGGGIIIEAASAEEIRKLPGGDAVLIFPASSHWLQENEDPEWLDKYNPEGIPSRPGMHKFRIFPK